eukprot:GHVU01140577.1.p1 GENE.GHVU01140577.1~~GHVU01140577.1.p1  ORF type:complete len:157 (+),score=25.91 GHVU01140577.1:656-1126(+)
MVEQGLMKLHQKSGGGGHFALCGLRVTCKMEGGGGRVAMALRGVPVPTTTRSSSSRRTRPVSAAAAVQSVQPGVAMAMAMRVLMLVVLASQMVDSNCVAAGRRDKSSAMCGRIRPRSRGGPGEESLVVTTEQGNVQEGESGLEDGCRVFFIFTGIS